jgi:uncharacterized protein (TIGR03437 family)
MRIRIAKTAIAAAVFSFACHAQGIISTFAGSATCCNSADGLQATSAWLPGVSGIARDGQGNLYIWDVSSSKIRKVNSAGVLSTVAGNGTAGYTGDGGPAINAEIFGSTALAGIVVDGSGNIYFSDGNNQVVRKIDTGGIVHTIAGNGLPGYSGDGAAATKAMLQYPSGLALDGAGNLYIADSSNNRVRKVDLAGNITTFAGNGNVVFSGDNVQAATTAVVDPQGLAFDGSGNLYISEVDQSRVRRVDTTGLITTVAGQTKKTIGFTGDGGLATAATLAGPIGLVIDPSGNLYIADNSNSRVRKVDAAGIITTYAGSSGNSSSPIGDGGPATSAYLGVPKTVALDSAGNLYIGAAAGGSARVRKVAPSGASFSTNPSSLSFAYTIGGNAPAAQTVALSSSAGAAGYTAAATSTGNWLSVSPAAGSTPLNLSISVNPAGLAGGNYAGTITVTPTASGSSPLSFGVTLAVTGAGAPVITPGGVVNALGYQTKIAPDTVFVIFGSAMGPAALVQASAPNYPNSLGGTSITFTPTGGGPTTIAKMVYSFASQIAALLPSSITPGTYSVQVTYNTLTSAPQTVTVVARSFGIATQNAAGTGTAQATIGNVNGGASLTRFTTGSTAFGGLTWTLSPAHPGDTLVLWGTGGGADPANDAGGTSGDQTAAGNFIVSVSGRQIAPLYAGASFGYPGLWQINFTLPLDITPDCFASVQVTAGGELSNAVIIPIAAAGQSACSNPNLTTAALAALDAGGDITLAGFSVTRQNSVTTVVTNGTPSVTTGNQELITGSVASYSAAEYASLFSGIQIGACTLTDRTASAAAKSPSTPDGYLDAGTTIPASGPGLPAGTALGIVSNTNGPIYDVVLPNGTIQNSGKYTVAGNGGKAVAAFNVSATFPNSFAVNGWDSLTTIDRTKPLTLSWNGSGFDQVVIIGSTSAVLGKDAQNINIIRNVSFTCQVPAAPGSYTLPTQLLAYLLPEGVDSASLAKGSGILTVETYTATLFNPALVAGGNVTYGAFTSLQSFSRNLIVQ